MNFAVWIARPSFSLPSGYTGKSDDILIPLPPTGGRWNACQPYSESEMIKLLQPEAEKKLKMPSGM